MYILKLCSVYLSDDLEFFPLLKDFNGKFTYAQAHYGYNEKHRAYINPKEKKETQEFTVSGPSTMAKIYINGFSSNLVNVSDPEEV